MSKSKLPICFIIGILLLTACSPSQADIQKAIEQTQAAAPTATHTLTPTDTPIPSPTETRTPEPTETPVLPALSDVVLTFEDIDGIIEGFYTNQYLDKTEEVNDEKALETHARLYSGNGAGDILVVLHRFENKAAAREYTESLKEKYTSLGKPVDMLRTITVDDWAIEKNDGEEVMLFFTQGSVAVLIDLELTAGLSGEDVAGFLTYLGIAQRDRLSEADYK